MIILAFLLLAATPKIQIQFELRHEGFTGKSMPILVSHKSAKADRKEVSDKDLGNLLKEICRECERTKQRADYRIIFTINHRPWGEQSEMIWEVRSRNGNELGRGFAYYAYKAVQDAIAVVSQNHKQSNGGSKHGKN